MKLPTQRLLSDKTFFIEFQGYLSNHAKHAIVALDKLQAPPERIQGYWDMYTNLTPYNLELDENPKSWDQVKPITAASWKELKGKKEHWQEMCAFLDQERQTKFNDDINLLVKEYAPDLLGGIAGALTHGIIHLGWGLDAQNTWMATEGLAYLNFCYLGVDEGKLIENAVQESSPLESVLRIADEWEANDLKENWIAQSKKKYGKDFHPELIVAGFQWELAKILDSPHDVATKLPTWLNDSPLEQIWKDLYKATVLVYLATKDKDDHGNFLILHSITSLWGLEHVCRVIDDEHVERKALKQYYASLVCLLAASANGFPSREVLENASSAFPLSKNDQQENVDWKPMVADAIQETEEHNIKLVYVARELWNRYDYWHGFSAAAKTFTTTPNIGPSSTNYKA